VFVQQYRKAAHRRTDWRSDDTIRRFRQQNPFWNKVWVRSVTPAIASR